MRDQGIAERERASVSGLGVCDAWRFELSEAQWPWLLDELDEIRGPLEEALKRAWAQQAVENSEGADEEVIALEHELRLMRRMRAQLPAADHAHGIVFVGPAELLRDLARGTLRNVVDALNEAVNSQRLGEREARQRLVETARAASEWARTFVECQELELFSFDATDDALMRQYAD